MASRVNAAIHRMRLFMSTDTLEDNTSHLNPLRHDYLATQFAVGARSPSARCMSSMPS